MRSMCSSYRCPFPCTVYYIHLSIPIPHYQYHKSPPLHHTHTYTHTLSLYTVNEIAGYDITKIKKRRKQTKIETKRTLEAGFVLMRASHCHLLISDKEEKRGKSGKSFFYGGYIWYTTMMYTGSGEVGTKCRTFPPLVSPAKTLYQVSIFRVKERIFLVSFFSLAVRACGWVLRRLVVAGSTYILYCASLVNVPKPGMALVILY